MTTQYTVRVRDEDLEEEIERFREESDLNKSEAIVTLVERGLRLDQVEARRDDLRRQLREANARDDDLDELVEYVEEEKSLRNEERERQRMKEEAWFGRRWKWKITGMPSVDGGE